VCLKMGGDVCNALGKGKKCFAVFSGDLAPAFIAMKAKVRLISDKGERLIPLENFYTGDGVSPLSILPEEILAGVEIPKVSKGTFSQYFKYRIRDALDFPLAGLAISLRFEGKDKVCRDAHVVVGAVGTRPQVIQSIGEFLDGKCLDQRVIEDASDLAYKEAKPVNNLASSASYRRLMIRIFCEKALNQAMGKFK